MALPLRGDRDGDRQDVVDHQRAARDHADPRSEQMRGHHVAAASGRELLDDAAVGGGDDEDGDCRGDRQGDGQVGVLAERKECLLRTVGGRGEAVRPQAHPGQEGDERHLVEVGRVGDVPGRAEDDPPDAFGETLLFHLRVWLSLDHLC